jgi:hypothetical protein
MVYSRAERVFTLERYFALKSFAAARGAFSNAYPDKEVPNETNNTPTGNKISKHRKYLCVSENVVDICCKAVL